MERREKRIVGFNEEKEKLLRSPNQQEGGVEQGEKEAEEEKEEKRKRVVIQ